MHFEETVTYPMSINRVLEMYADPDFMSLRMSKAGLTDTRISVSTPEPGSIDITCTAQVDPSTLPAAARRFLSSQITIHFAEKWSKTSTGSPRASTVLKADGAPLHLRAISTVRGDERSTTRNIQGEFNVNIPLLGRSIEAKASGSIGVIFRAEHQAALEWLKTHPE